MNPERRGGFTPQAEPNPIQPIDCLPKKIVEVVAETYFSPKPWEGNGDIYRKVGIRTFKRYLPTGEPIIKLARRRGDSHVAGYSLSKPTLEKAKKYELTTRIYETVHDVGIIAGIIGLIPFVLHETVDTYTGIASGLVFFNSYAVMLQRYNRARIYNLVKRNKQIKKG